MARIVARQKAMDMVNGESGWRVVPATTVVATDGATFVAVEKSNESDGKVLFDIIKGVKVGSNLSFYTSDAGRIVGKYLGAEGSCIVKMQKSDCIIKSAKVLYTLNDTIGYYRCGDIRQLEVLSSSIA